MMLLFTILFFTDFFVIGPITKRLGFPLISTIFIYELTTWWIRYDYISIFALSAVAICLAPMIVKRPPLGTPFENEILRFKSPHAGFNYFFRKKQAAQVMEVGNIAVTLYEDTEQIMSAYWIRDKRGWKKASPRAYQQYTQSVHDITISTVAFKNQSKLFISVADVDSKLPKIKSTGNSYGLEYYTAKASTTNGTTTHYCALLESPGSDFYLLINGEKISPPDSAIN